MTPADKFRWIEARMQQACPAIVAEASQLAATIIDPITAGPLEVWKVLWDKPLFAYTRVEVGSTYCTRLAPFAEGKRWVDWSDPTRPFLTLDGPANREASFAFTEHASEQLKALRIARGRLFAVQGAAQALARWHAASPAPLAALVPLDLDVLVATSRRALGPRWGYITVMHFLTDAGLTCKPDRWLVRSMLSLGLVEGVNPDRDVPSCKDAIAIARAVRSLVVHVDGTFAAARLRYFDKILMEASRQSVIDRPQRRAL